MGRTKHLVLLWQRDRRAGNHIPATSGAPAARRKFKWIDVGALSHRRRVGGITIVAVRGPDEFGCAVDLIASALNARGMTDDDVMDSARRSTMDELGEATLNADKVLVF